MKYAPRIRWTCRRIAQRIENREKMEGGINQLPRTRTSSVPSEDIRKRALINVGPSYHLELHRSSAWDHSDL